MKIRLLAVFAAASLLYSCSSSPKMKINSREYESDTYVIKTEVPQFEGFEDSKFEAELNSEAEAENEKQISDFKMRIDESLADNKKAELTITVTPSHSSDKFLSSYSDKSIFVSGIHPMLWRSSQNIDISNKSTIVLSDLFSDDKWQEFLNARINDVLKEKQNDYAELWKKPQLGERSNTDFYISNGYLVLYYQPYELSYYAKGIVEVPVKISSLRGYMKENYYNELKK